MEAVLLFAAGVAVGLLVGIAVGAARAFRLVRARNAARGAAAGIARVSLEALPTRSSADILSGRVRIVLGGLPYVLPVLPIRQSDEWLANVDQSFASVLSALEDAADDTPMILQILAGQQDRLLEMLRSYDVTGVLPDDAYVNEFATRAEILVAAVEVWRAANPLVATAAEAAAAATVGTESGSPSSPLTPTDGVLATSAIE